MFVVINDLRDFAATILLAVGALLPNVDPLSGAPIYLARRPTSRRNGRRRF